MKIVKALLISAILLFANGSSYAESDNSMPGDSFRRVAAGYENNAAKAVKEAGRTSGERAGRYLELASVYQEMATIKRRAAKQGDKGRWNDMNWDRYYQLESQRDHLVSLVNWGQTKKQSENKEGCSTCYTEQAVKFEDMAQQARYDAEDAEGMSRQLFKDLAGVYQAMANVKHHAAKAIEVDSDIDWAPYRSLEIRRDRLKNQLNHTRYRR